MAVDSLPKTVTRQRRGWGLNPGTTVQHANHSATEPSAATQTKLTLTITQSLSPTWRHRNTQLQSYTFWRRFSSAAISHATNDTQHRSQLVHSNKPAKACKVMVRILLLNQSIIQSVDFYSGLSGATTARTTNWIMTVDDVRIWLLEYTKQYEYSTLYFNPTNLSK